jgi:hypothetical protein
LPPEWCAFPERDPLAHGSALTKFSSSITKN